jgi:hypothetical protein
MSKPERLCRNTRRIFLDKMKYIPDIDLDLIVVEKRVSKKPDVFVHEQPVRSPKRKR